METKQKFAVIISMFLGIFLVFSSSCENEDDNEPLPDNTTNGKTTAVFNTNVTYGIMTDQDSNVYKTVTIGTQTWMAENLRTTKYNDGTPIPHVINNDEWIALTTGAYCNIKNITIPDTIATYGLLYNWYAVNTEKLAPEGWHIPSDEEWTTLATYLGGESIAGNKLKEFGTMHWTSPNPGATNETGFTALPGGYRNETNGAFEGIGLNGIWWSKTEIDTDYAWYRFIHYNNSDFLRYHYVKEYGLSVRCVKD
ncbi:MAG: fibrobacter succinogenes major paralogous domain-containing protein [Bacteroidota bacterium]|nr:MAG: fibrobacter succinogenes major paralogous domain-containing protein [Bacteroidota bacterium]